MKETEWAYDPLICVCACMCMRVVCLMYVCMSSSFVCNIFRLDVLVAFEQPLFCQLVQSSRPHSPCGGWYMGHVHKILSRVCSSVPHSQVALCGSPYLCMYILNLPTFVCKRLRHIHANLGKSRPAGLG